MDQTNLGRKVANLTKMIALLAITLLPFIHYTTPILASFGYGLAQEKGVTQGWLAPYNGEQQGYTGIPCGTRQPSDIEKKEIITLLCESGETSTADCQQKTFDWIRTYPTCASRNIGVRKLANGTLETYDQPPQTPETSPVIQVQQPPKKEDKASLKLDLTKLAGGLASLIFVLVLLYSVWQLNKVSKIEKKIVLLDQEWDKVPSVSKNPYMNNNTLLKTIAKKREPIERKLQLLKQERQFILDKIPLMGLFRK